jgi:hypothetical protein
MRYRNLPSSFGCGRIRPTTGNMVVASAESQENRDKLIRNYPLIFQKNRQDTYISCWHQNDGESAAMWKLYLKIDEGIALQTSFGILHGELSRSARLIHLGRVRYCDYKNSIPGGRVVARYSSEPLTVFRIDRKIHASEFDEPPPC